ncbi:MAG: carbohydrate ABC transporter permease [Crenarchaeota archaeon]|nr:carbohydrate ABC transporter permease [Thermoproteota archaeon]
MGRRFPLSIIPVWAFLVFVIWYFALPLVWMVVTAFNPNAYSVAFEIPKHPSLANFLKLAKPVSGVVPYQWIVNSVIISLATAGLTTAVSLGAAFVLTRFSFRGQGAMLTAFVIFRLLPALLIALPLLILFRMWGLLDNYGALILALSALILPFTLMIAESYFRAIPITYEEAAMIDGCTKVGAFLRVTLPLAAPGLATIFLLAFVIAWSQFVLPLFLIRTPSLFPASVGIYFFYGQYGKVDYGKIAAFSLIYSIPVIVVYFVIQKYLRKGIAGLVAR